MINRLLGEDVLEKEYWDEIFPFLVFNSTDLFLKTNDSFVNLHKKRLCTEDFSKSKEFLYEITTNTHRLKIILGALIIAKESGINDLLFTGLDNKMMGVALQTKEGMELYSKLREMDVNYLFRRWKS